MRKIHRNSKLLALTLTASIATFGCTTNWTRSDGEPAMGTTNATSPSATPGTSGGTIPQPMTSSSQIPTRTPEEALAIMQQSRSIGPQGIVLGPVGPPNTGQARVGGTVTPSFDGRIQQLTINSSISNPYGPQPAIISGAGEGVDAAAIFGDVVVGTAVTPATAGGTTVTAPATIGTVPVTPTSAALPVTSGVLSASTGTLTPSASSAAVPTPTVATSPVILGNTGMLSSSTVTNGTAAAVTAPARSRATVQVPLRLNRGVVATSATSPITVTQSATGKLVISNVK